MLPPIKAVRALGATAVLATAGCSANPDELNLPKLNCSKPVIGSAEYFIEPLHEVQSSTLNCGGYQGDLPNPELVQFRIYNLVDLSIGANKKEAGQTLQQRDDGKTIVPVAGVAFQPFISSLLNMSAIRTAAEFQLDSTKCPVDTDVKNDHECAISPSRFLGVVTPSSDWCTDSTGVATYEFWMTCNGASSQFTVSLVAAAAKVLGAYEFSVTVDDEE